ncbi:MAG: alpha/beta hydrolase [Bacteroidales bacterium]|nr:alpha/beta hydrolase [Bacteroidales bacterium]MDD3286845.1 alpha/beta hydrolase [Bacteroidales bacterium]MDD4068614.1 alpha/beta hydrolase [Bacteroidales bacterium]
MKRVFKIIVFCAFISCIGFHSFAIKPDKVYVLRPENLGLIYRDLNVTTSDGLKIKTWFYPAQPALSEKEINEAWNNPVKKPYVAPYSKNRPTIIIANGDAGNMSYQQVHFALNFTSKGYNVVTFDWRGFGESSEWEINNDYLVYSEFLLDYDAVIKEVLKQNEEVDTNRIAVFGWSTGAYLSMAAASKYENIKAFVGIGLITSFDDVLPLLKQLQTHKDRNLIVPDDYPKELLPVNLAANYNKSTFLIVGEKDNRTPVWMSKKIYSLLPSKKELWIVEGAEHGGQNGPIKDFDLFNKRFIEFLDKNL